MKIYRSVISIFLLLCYSVGFAHGLIPHCQENTDGAGSNTEHCEKHHQHEHHEHDNNESVSHFTHQGHCDDSMLDLLICLMDDTEHPCSDNGSSFFTLVKTGNSVSDKPDQSKLIAVYLAVFTEWGIIQRSKAEFYPEVAITYSTPPLFDTPYRGPPTISS